MKSEAGTELPLYGWAMIADSIGIAFTEFMDWPVDRMEMEISAFNVRQKVRALEDNEFEKKLDRERKKKGRK